MMIRIGLDFPVALDGSPAFLAEQSLPRTPQELTGFPNQYFGAFSSSNLRETTPKASLSAASLFEVT
jgi:hypothetical protein